MIKMRVIRETFDTTASPASFTPEIAWIGCIASQLRDLFPPSDGNTQDALEYHESADGKVRTSTRFEGFAKGKWYRIDDPRIHPAPIDEMDLLDLLAVKGCPECYTIDPSNLDPGQPCASCEAEDSYNDMQYIERCRACEMDYDTFELNDNDCCAKCAHLVECSVCPYFFEPSQLKDGKCTRCNIECERDAKIDKLLASEE